MDLPVIKKMLSVLRNLSENNVNAFVIHIAGLMASRVKSVLVSIWNACWSKYTSGGARDNPEAYLEDLVRRESHDCSEVFQDSLKIMWKWASDGSGK